MILGLVRILVPVLLLPLPLAGQDAPLEVRRDDGTVFDLVVRSDRGYAVVADAGLTRLGWTVELDPEGLSAVLGDSVNVRMTLDSPFFRWNSELLQMVGAPYAKNGAVWIPVQFLLDFLPARIPDRYRPSRGRTLEVVTEIPVEESVRGVVIIDPGHGGRDPGAVGRGGRREKDIALAIGRALAHVLASRDGLEVQLTRDRDTLVPLWERGRLATEWKGDRPGAFVSIHVNSMANTNIRGFETYFLSEARTEHEARVAANENAPLALDAEEDVTVSEDPEVDFILRELRNRDHLRWSSVLAEDVQRHLEAVHPGPNRGVKQGPLAVITNALMPAVLVEVGFVTHPAEERLLSRGEFQREIAEAIANAVDTFFDRYPPGASTTAGGNP